MNAHELETLMERARSQSALVRISAGQSGSPMLRGMITRLRYEAESLTGAERDRVLDLALNIERSL